MSAPAAHVIFHFDEPVDWNEPGRLLLIRGWMFSAAAPAVVGIEAHTTGTVFDGIHGLFRPDVAAAHGHAVGSSTSGFALRMPRPVSRPSTAEFFAVLADGARKSLRVVTWS